MRLYNNTIALTKNKRGIWDLDPIKGCKSGLENSVNGCYNDCYAYKTAKRYGINFSVSVNRNFEDSNHLGKTIDLIEKIDMPFIRMGCSGDPSEDWEHTINIIKKLKSRNQLSLFDLNSKKKIVIITRHWNNLTDSQLNELKQFNVCINTSISAIDDENVFNNCLNQYNRLKPYCKSILRIVSFDFNLSNIEGLKYSKIQENLFKNENTLDTVFRPSKNNPLVINNIIHTKQMAFMKSKTLVSKMNKKAYLGKCGTCQEMCGLNI
jgi:hypothetical protein